MVQLGPKFDLTDPELMWVSHKPFTMEDSSRRGPKLFTLGRSKSASGFNMGPGA